jgi:PAS domain S-box-containing protein
MSFQKKPYFLKLLISTFIPILAAALQWQLWPVLAPKTWIFLYPAVFFSASIGGLPGGVIATVIAALLGCFLFMAPQFALEISDSKNLVSLSVFCSMGLLFSLTFEKFFKASKQLEDLNRLELDLQENRLKLALNAANAGIWEWDLASNKNTWTENLWELYGIEPHSREPSYDAWLSSVGLADQTKMGELIASAVTNRTELNLEWRVARLFDGKERWLTARGQPVFDDQGKLISYRGIVFDNTSRKAIETQLQSSEEMMNFALETLNAGAWTLSLENYTAKRTSLLDQVFGYDEPLPEWTSDTFLDHVLPEEREAIIVSHRSAAENQANWEVECRIRRNDGAIRWINSKAVHKFNDTGQPVALMGVVQDITERKEADNKLRYEEIRYRAFVDQAAPDAMFVHDHDGSFIEVNRRACQSTGYSKEELLAMNVLDLEQDHDFTGLQALWNQLIPGETKIAQGHHRHKDGYKFPVEVSFGLVIYEGERLYLALVRDVTERHRMQQELKEKERLLVDSQAIAHIGSWMMDVKTRQITWSDESYRLYGLSPETDKAPSWEQYLTLLHPDDRSTLQIWCEDCVAGKEPAALEFRTNLINGQNHWLWGICQLEMGMDGEPWRMVGTVQDITQQKDITDALRDSENRFKSFLDNSVVIAWLKDSQGRYVYLSANFEKRIGKPYKEWSGKTDYEIWPVEFAKQYHAYDQKVLADKQPIEIIEESINADGSLIWWLKCKFPFQDSHGDWFVGGLAVDITHQVIATDHLKEALSEKELLLKEIYHRVKNNLQIISSLINLQIKSIKNDQAADILKQSADRIKAMAILHERLYQSKDLAKIEFNEYVRCLADHLLVSFGVITSRIKLNLLIEEVYLDVDTAIPCGLIINELLSNAFLHAFPNHRVGEISLSFKQDQNNFVLSVSDNGIGFPADFEVQDSGSLGLHLVSLLTKQLLGKLAISNKNGATLEMQFPIIS